MWQRQAALAVATAGENAQISQAYLSALPGKQLSDSADQTVGMWPAPLLCLLAAQEQFTVLLTKQ